MVEFLYAGSANLSGAAWGVYEPSPDGTPAYLNMSFEAGILCVYPEPIVFPLPWASPAQPYIPHPRALIPAQEDVVSRVLRILNSGLMPWSKRMFDLLCDGRHQLLRPWTSRCVDASVRSVLMSLVAAGAVAGSAATWSASIAQRVFPATFPRLLWCPYGALAELRELRIVCEACPLEMYRTSPRGYARICTLCVV
jgi:hypothetical protein